MGASACPGSGGGKLTGSGRCCAKPAYWLCSTALSAFIATELIGHHREVVLQQVVWPAVEVVAAIETGPEGADTTSSHPVWADNASCAGCRVPGLCLRVFEGRRLCAALLMSAMRAIRSLWENRSWRQEEVLV